MIENKVFGPLVPIRSHCRVEPLVRSFVLGLDAEFSVFDEERVLKIFYYLLSGEVGAHIEYRYRTRATRTWTHLDSIVSPIPRLSAPLGLITC